MAIFGKAEDGTDWRALYFEERERVTKLTDQLIRMKKQGYTAPLAKERRGEPTTPVEVAEQSHGVRLDWLAQQIGQARPNLTADEAMAAAREAAARFVADA